MICQRLRIKKLSFSQDNLRPNHRRCKSAAFLRSDHSLPTIGCAEAVGTCYTFAVFGMQSTAWLSGTAAAGGIGLINSIGNLTGFGGPYLIGWVEDAAGSTALGPLTLPVAALGRPSGADRQGRRHDRIWRAGNREMVCAEMGGKVTWRRRPPSPLKPRAGIGHLQHPIEPFPNHPTQSQNHDH